MIAARSRSCSARDDMLERERLLAAERRCTQLCHAATAGGLVGGVLARQAGCDRGVDGAGVEDGVQGWRSRHRRPGVCEEGGRGVEALVKRTTPKGEYVVGDGDEGGTQRCGDPDRGDAEGAGGRSTGRRICTGAPGKPERFVRPVRWMVALLDGEVVPVSLAARRRGNDAWASRAARRCAGGDRCARRSMRRSWWLRMSSRMWRSGGRRFARRWIRVTRTVRSALARGRGAGGYGDAPDGVAER